MPNKDALNSKYFYKINLVYKFLLISLSCSYNFSFAQQDSTKKQMGIGIENGLSLGFMDRFGPYGSDKNYNYSNKPRKGLCTNLFYFYQVHPFIRLQLGIGYTGYGSHFYKSSSQDVITQTSTHTSVSKKTIYTRHIYSLDYLETQLLAKLFSTPHYQNCPFFTLGISNGILINASENFQYDDHSTHYDLSFYTQPLTINGIIGCGVEFRTNKKISFGFESRLHFGLTSTFKSDKVYYSKPGATYSTNARGHVAIFSFHVSTKL